MPEEENVTTVQVETALVVFAEFKSLNYWSRTKNKRELRTGPRYWYESTKVDILKDRWVYVFSYFMAAVPPDNLLFQDWRLIQEYYVDAKGFYWRSDESDLFDGHPFAKPQRFRPARHRKEAIEAKQLGTADSHALLPYYIDGNKTLSVTVAMPYPLPANRIDDFIAMAKDVLLPWATAWEGENRPIVNRVRTKMVKVVTEQDGQTTTDEVEATVIPTVDPIELAVRTNRVYQNELKAFRKIDTDQTEEERFARTLHQLFNTKSGTFRKARNLLKGESLDGIRKVFKDTDERLLAANSKFEARARVLTEFLGQRLFRTAVHALRTDDESSTVDSPNFVYLLYAVDAATDQLSLSKSGHEFLERASQPGGLFGFGDVLNDYVFPLAPPPSKTVGNIKKGLSAIVSIYGKLIPKIKISEAVVAADMVRRNLAALTGHEFVRVRRSWEPLLNDYVVIEFKKAEEGTGFHWIKRSSLKAMQDAATEEAVEYVEGRKVHGDRHKDRLGRVGLALDVINLSLTQFEFDQKEANGEVTLRNKVDMFNARLALGVSMISSYATWRYGATAAEGLTKKVAIIGAIPAFHSSMMSITDSWESYDKGHIGKWAGQAMAGWAGLVGTVAAFIPGAGLVVFVAGLVATAGYVITEYFTESTAEEFARFCEWGKGDSPEAAKSKPKYSAYPFSSWKGRYDIQREALSRILCAFQLEPRHSPKGAAVQLTMGHFTADSIIELEWEMWISKKDAPSEFFRQSRKIAGSALRENPRLIVQQPKEFLDVVGVRTDLAVTVKLDVRGDGSAVYPAKGCELLIIRDTEPMSGPISSLDIQE